MIDLIILGVFISGFLVGNALGLVANGAKSYAKGYRKGSELWKDAHAKGLTLNIKSPDILKALDSHERVGIRGDTLVDPKNGITVNLEGVKYVTDDLDGAKVTTGKDGTITIRREEP